MAVMERIQAEVEGHPIVLFMKGTPEYPMCGFSARAVQALQAAAKDRTVLSISHRLYEAQGGRRVVIGETEA